MLRNVSLSLGAVGCLGVLFLAGRAIAGRPGPEDTARDSAATAATPADRLWYGGTLAPIVVEAPSRAAKPAPAPSCPAVGT